MNSTFHHTNHRWTGLAVAAQRVPTARTGSMALRVGLLGLWLLAGLPMLAHDPYEITATLYLRSNRVELFTEMELSVARLLMGTSSQDGSESESPLVSNGAQSRWHVVAGGLFTLRAGEEILQPSATNVTHGVEDHIQFQLTFPAAADRPLRIAAPGLERLPPEDRYGVSLTVLDMVRLKVLGQSVLFAESPPTVFAPAPVAETTLPTASPTSPVVMDSIASAPTVPFSNSQHETAAAPVEGSMALRWWLSAAVVLMVVALVWWWRCRA